MSALDHKRCCTAESDSPHVCLYCLEDWPCNVARIRHELAEVILAVKITPSGNPSYDEGKDAGLDLAADLIDYDASSDAS